MQAPNQADDQFVVTRYDAAKDLFVGESPTRKVVRWMPIPNARRVAVKWEAWAEVFAGE